MILRRSIARLRMAGVAALLLLINAVAFAAFTWPRLDRVRAAEARAKEVSTRKATLERAWERVHSRRELLAQNQRDIEALSRDYLKPRSTDLFPAQREIESMARAAGLNPRTSSYDIKEIKGTGLLRCEVTLPLDGTYRNLTDFLSRIERTPRFIVVDQMALALDEVGASMNLKLSAIFKDDNPHAPR